MSLNIVGLSKNFLNKWSTLNKKLISDIPIAQRYRDDFGKIKATITKHSDKDNVCRHSG